MSHASSQVHSNTSSPVAFNHACSAFPEHLKVVDSDGDTVGDGMEDMASDNIVNLLQGALSLLNFSASDDEGACKATTCKAT